VQDRQVIAAFRCGSQPEQLAGLDVVEQLAVRRGSRMVKLVDDDDVKVIWRQVLEVGGVKALD
jgi:hypothetical protein